MPELWEEADAIVEQYLDGTRPSLWWRVRGLSTTERNGDLCAIRVLCAIIDRLVERVRKLEGDRNG